MGGLEEPEGKEGGKWRHIESPSLSCQSSGGHTRSSRLLSSVFYCFIGSKIETIFKEQGRKSTNSKVISNGAVAYLKLVILCGYFSKNTYIFVNK